MVRLGIYIEKLKEPEKVLKLALKEEDGCVYLHAVKPDGSHEDGGNILCIDKEGYLFLCVNVNKEIGLQLDASGSIKKK